MTDTAAYEGPFLVFLDDDFHKVVETEAEAEAIKEEGKYHAPNTRIHWVSSATAAGAAGCALERDELAQRVHALAAQLDDAKDQIASWHAVARVAEGQARSLQEDLAKAELSRDRWFRLACWDAEQEDRRLAWAAQHLDRTSSSHDTVTIHVSLRPGPQWWKPWTWF